MSFGLKLFDILTANATAAKSYINRMLAKKQDKLTFDSAPTAGSSNLVTSDGIRKAIDTATPNVDFQIILLKMEQVQQVHGRLVSVVQQQKHHKIAMAKSLQTHILKRLEIRLRVILLHLISLAI